jgi:hypothetical protein
MMHYNSVHTKWYEFLMCEVGVEKGTALGCTQSLDSASVFDDNAHLLHNQIFHFRN